MNKKEQSEQYTPKEAAQRRDEVIKRMLNTPPKPHKVKSKKIKKSKKKSD